MKITPPPTPLSLFLFFSRFVDIQKQLETGGSKSKDKETSSLIEATTIKILKREKVKVARRKDHIIKKKNPADELVCFLNSVEK